MPKNMSTLTGNSCATGSTAVYPCSRAHVSYRLQYPESTVLLVRSNPIDFFRRAAFLEAIRPAAELLRARSNGQIGPTSDVLVHTLSNGGCLTLQELNEHLRKNASAAGSAQPATIPARAFIYDSCPGLSTLTSTIRAFSAGLRNPLVYYPAVAAITVMYSVLRFWTMCASSIAAVRNSLH